MSYMGLDHGVGHPSSQYGLDHGVGHPSSQYPRWKSLSAPFQN